MDHVKNALSWNGYTRIDLHGVPECRGDEPRPAALPALGPRLVQELIEGLDAVAEKSTDNTK